MKGVSYGVPLSIGKLIEERAHNHHNHFGNDEYDNDVGTPDGDDIEMGGSKGSCGGLHLTHFFVTRILTKKK